MTRLLLPAILTTALLTACAETGGARVTSSDGNVIGGFDAETGQSLGSGAQGGPAPGTTEAATAARKAYYQGPRANEWN